MLSIIWLAMLLISVVFAVIEGRLDLVVAAVTEYAKLGFELALGLTAVMSLWLGILRIATASGLIDWFAWALRPIMVRLFPDIPPKDPAMGAMVMNISANMLGMTHAATPFGLQAMKELQRLNKSMHSASDAMCVFLAINTSSVQLIPATAIAYLATNGASHPSRVIITSLLATSLSTLVAIISVKLLAKLPYFSLNKIDIPQPQHSEKQQENLPDVNGEDMLEQKV